MIRGSISAEGSKSFSPILDTVGFFAPSVEDLQLLADAFRIVADSIPRPLSLQQSRFACIRTAQWGHANRDTVAALNAAVELLQQQGAEVVDVQLPTDFDDLHHWHRVLMQTNGAVTFYSDYISAGDQLDPLLRGYVENKGGWSHADRLEAMDGISKLRPLADSIIGAFTAVITPSAMGEAPAMTRENMKKRLLVVVTLMRPV
ncbi:amidase signature domain-containing protein [Stachybotrys elegans]|uniref:Amidase signature domain-containing protein n=1 Tax=Stachybotrys elegans TaxID=80388 RepID=A0A8K0SIW0_9HYPO|nr:amidase signature domain-containing protein [Stachybotrys elegans]